jgi:hypothetical protein
MQKREVVDVDYRHGNINAMIVKVLCDIKGCSNNDNQKGEFCKSLLHDIPEVQAPTTIAFFFSKTLPEYVYSDEWKDCPLKISCVLSNIRQPTTPS